MSSLCVVNANAKPSGYQFAKAKSGILCLALLASSLEKLAVLLKERGLLASSTHIPHQFPVLAQKSKFGTKTIIKSQPVWKTLQFTGRHQTPDNFEECANPPSRLSTVPFWHRFPSLPLWVVGWHYFGKVHFHCRLHMN